MLAASLFVIIQDSYGRLTQAIDRTQSPAVTKNHHNDWATGNMDLESDGTDTRSQNHGPGYTRINIDLGLGWEIEDMMHNGTWGNGKWGTDKNGNITPYSGYSTFGNTILQETFNGAGSQEPNSIGGQTRPIDSYDQITVGNSASRDNTPMIGAMDSPAISGAKAGGNNGNPDTGYGLSPGELEDIERLIRELERQRCANIPVPLAASLGSSSEGWSITDGHDNWTAPYQPPEDILPGSGTADAPPNAPKDKPDQGIGRVFDMRVPPIKCASNLTLMGFPPTLLIWRQQQ